MLMNVLKRWEASANFFRNSAVVASDSGKTLSTIPPPVTEPSSLTLSSRSSLVIVLHHCCDVSAALIIANRDPRGCDKYHEAKEAANRATSNRPIRIRRGWLAA